APHPRRSRRRDHGYRDRGPVYAGIQLASRRLPFVYTACRCACHICHLFRRAAARHHGIGETMKQIGRFYLVAMLMFLYTPILVMMAMGFNASPLYELPFTFSTRWYEALLGNRQLLTAGMNSIIIAVITSVVATTL